jgi:hypothetical protein
MTIERDLLQHLQNKSPQLTQIQLINLVYLANCLALDRNQAFPDIAWEKGFYGPWSTALAEECKSSGVAAPLSIANQLLISCVWLEYGALEHELLQTASWKAKELHQNYTSDDLRADAKHFNLDRLLQKHQLALAQERYHMFTSDSSSYSDCEEAEVIVHEREAEVIVHERFDGDTIIYH